MASGEANNPWLHIGAPSTGVRGVSGDVNTGTIDSSETAKLSRANVFSKAQAVTPVALVDAATIVTDASLSNTFTVTLAGVRTLANPTNLTNGCIYNWRVTQGIGTTNGLSYGNKFKWPGGVTPTLSLLWGDTDLISGQYYSDLDIILCTILKDFS